MEGGSDYICRFCGGSFTKLQALGGHMKGHQSERAAERNQKAQAEHSRNQIVERSRVGYLSSSTSNLRPELRQTCPIFSTTEAPPHHFTSSLKLSNFSYSSPNITSETREFLPQFHSQPQQQQPIPDKDLRRKGLPDLNLPIIDHAQQIPDLNLPDTDD